MKIFIVSIVLFLFTIQNGISQGEGNYILIIDNDSIRVDLGKEVNYTSTKGQSISLKVVQPDVLTYEDDAVSFDYGSKFSVTQTVLDEGIEQLMVMSALGNGILIQKYSTINPSTLSRLMLNEITKESISYGYAKKESKFSKKLASGHTIEGIQSVLTYLGSVETYTVATYGKKDQGIILVTMLLDNDSDEQASIIERFLNSLKIKD